MFSFFVPIIYDDGLKSALTCSTWAKRSRFSQVLAVSTVGTSRSRAPCGRSRAPRGLNDLGFLKCWRCPPLARRGHEPHLGALVTNFNLMLSFFLPTI